MTSATATQNDTIWLALGNYNVVALNAKLAGRVPELTQALRRGLPAYTDLGRECFYDLELKSGWFYIHVHDEARTIYLVAFSAR